MTNTTNPAMKSKNYILVITILIFHLSCGNSADYTVDFKQQTAGKYLYGADELITVYYEDNTLKLNFKGGEITPVSLDEGTFFVPDMYKKFQFITHPETQKDYLSIVNEKEDAPVTYNYLKVSDTFKTPSQYLKAGNYALALEGFLKIKAQDSLSPYINEWDFNRMGYRYMRDKEYDKAIGVLDVNAKLHPNSPNVYDSLADAYLIKGDSLQAFTNYKIALKMNQGNEGARKFLSLYRPSQD